MSCHRKVTHYRDGFGVKNKWTETCGLLSLLHLGLLFCHINIRTGPHYTLLPCCDGSAGSAPRTALGCASDPHPGDELPAALLGTALDPLSPAPGQRILRRDPAPPPPCSRVQGLRGQCKSRGHDPFLLCSFCPGAPEGE